MIQPVGQQGGLSGQVTASEPDWLRGAALVLANDSTVSALSWVAANPEWVSRILQSRGAILLRGFAPISIAQFGSIVTLVGGEPPQPYQNRSTPRTRIQDNIYTSTEYPASQAIPLHNENSFSSAWPRYIFFLCAQPAQQGGETPIADSRKVYAAISPGTREIFDSTGVTYVRNFGTLGLSWQETFQTTSPAEVETYCRLHDISYNWTSGERLQIRQTLPATRRHPSTGEWVWFNQAHLFHLSNLGTTGEELLSILGKDGVPRNAFLGDGADIELNPLREVRAAYQSNAASVSWRKNDLVILDNMLWAHGRQPYRGSRSILVAMTREISQ
jgi:alpha-ketoglutarate-dependent taurine dioxygenase